VGRQANGSATPRSASRRAPAPMPAAAKEALTENGGPKLRPTARPANGKASPAKKPAAGDSAWTEQQELALVQVRQHTLNFEFIESSEPLLKRHPDFPDLLWVVVQAVMSTTAPLHCCRALSSTAQD